MHSTARLTGAVFVLLASTHAMANFESIGDCYSAIEDIHAVMAQGGLSAD
jgi:hypothetical protein